MLGESLYPDEGYPRVETRRFLFPFRGTNSNGTAQTLSFQKTEQHAVMSNLAETLNTIGGDLKTVYGKELVQTLPGASIIQDRFKLDNSGAFPKTGDFFSAWISLQAPQGHSFLGDGTENTSTNTQLGAALAGKTLPAQVRPSSYILRDQMSYVTLDRTAGQENGTQAVMSMLSYSGEIMAFQARNVLEMLALHGRQGLGAASGNISTLTVTFDPATTSIGILNALVGCRVEFFQSNLTSARTAHDSSNYLTVASIDTSDLLNPKATLVATGTTGVANIVTGDVMFIGGTRGVSVASSDTLVPYYEQVGLGLQLAETSATVFNISKTTYPTWKANVLASVGVFSPSAVMQAAALILSRGGDTGDFMLVVSPRSWGSLQSALATVEVFNNPASYSMQKKSGTDAIEINHAGMKIEVVPHPFQKDGQAYLLPVSQVHRIGDVDLSFSVPGKSGSEEYLYPVADNALMERQCRADWQIFLQKPASGCILTGITY